MYPQPDPVSPLPPQAEAFQSSPQSSHTPSEFRDYVSRRRCWLTIGAVLLLLVMCLGIVFAAHHYYIEFGGQGFLKTRDQYATPDFDAPKLFLPLRKVAMLGQDGRWSRSPMEVPYYACGDQQSSCEAYDQPDICCPVKMACHPTSLTPSNIYCCNSNETELECDGSWAALPKCLPSYFQCLTEEGGGCCPTNTLCSPNGCITTTNPSTISALTETATLTGLVTVMEVPAATATIAKQGEVAQSGVGNKDSMIIKLCFPYWCVSLLVFVAALMGLL